MIGAYHVLLAGHARSAGLTLVTANVGEFSRIPGSLNRVKLASSTRAVRWVKAGTQRIPLAVASDLTFKLPRRFPETISARSPSMGPDGASRYPFYRARESKASAPSRLNLRVEPLQFAPRFVDRELPIDGPLLLVDTG